MWRLIGDEWLKLLAQKKSYVMLFGIAALIGVMLALYLAPESRDELLRGGRELMPVEELRAYQDGCMFARLILASTMVILMPLVICTLAGECVAGEMQSGSLKLLLARSGSRTRVLLAKFLAVYLACLAYLAVFTLTPLLVGVLLFKVTPTQFLMLMSEAHGMRLQILSLGSAMGRYWLIVGYFAVAVAALEAVALFFSTLFNRMSAATVTVLSVYFITYVVAMLPFTEKLRPWLLSYMFNEAFCFWLAPVPWTRIGVDLCTLIWYAGVFLILALIHFRTKDIY